jgi:hypothetical protein
MMYDFVALALWYRCKCYNRIMELYAIQQVYFDEGFTYQAVPMQNPSHASTSSTSHAP